MNKIKKKQRKKSTCIVKLNNKFVFFSKFLFKIIYYHIITQKKHETHNLLIIIQYIYIYIHIKNTSFQKFKKKNYKNHFIVNIFKKKIQLKQTTQQKLIQ